MWFKSISSKWKRIFGFSIKITPSHSGNGFGSQQLFRFRRVEYKIPIVLRRTWGTAQPSKIEPTRSQWNEFFHRHDRWDTYRDQCWGSDVTLSVAVPIWKFSCQDCQLRCRTTGGCAHFSYYPTSSTDNCHFAALCQMTGWICSSFVPR